MIWVLGGLSIVSAAVAALRWLRVAQREHYLPGEVTKFLNRWNSSSILNRLADFAMFVFGLAAVAVDPIWILGLAALRIATPFGLGLRGVSSPLAWTDRLKRLAGAVLLLLVFVNAAAAVAGVIWPAVLALYLLPVLVDLALLILRPYEGRLGDTWVNKAAAKLESSGVTVAALTGSYGKTTTKNYLAHLISDAKRVYASPASFNNRMGLARSINEGLTPGTEVFIAEMGTYGPGEIADLCEWVPPDVSGMVSVGPVHLERFKTVEAVARAKSEILDRARVGVICIDYPELERLAAEREDQMEIVRVSGAGELVVGERNLGSVPEGVFGSNLAVALGMGQALGVDLDEMVARIPELPTTEHRQTITRSSNGFDIIDNTFNSNPAGARSALKMLSGAGTGRKVVVTPGMVELGRLQEKENRQFGELAGDVADDLIVVGRTNRRALTKGSGKGRASVTVVDSRQEAVEWVRGQLGPGDAVLYENDLPDHYP